MCGGKASGRYDLYDRMNRRGGVNGEAVEGAGFYRNLRLWQKIVFVCLVVILIIAILLFIAIWIIVPLVFMCSTSFQRFMIFLNVNDPKHPNFDDPQKYGDRYRGVVNFYLTTKNPKDNGQFNIGCWLLTPAGEITTTRKQDVETAVELLRATEYPVVLYLHGVGCNRIKPIETYTVIREKFLIVAVDHRGYGDSAPDVPPTEDGIIEDTVQIYRWIVDHTPNDVYVWGHSLGAAIAIHAVKRLKQMGTVPMGLIIESAFSTIREEVSSNSLGRVFAWLPWFAATILDPLEKNGIRFESVKNILEVDCPTMHLHAQDDNVIPWRLGKKLMEVAATERHIPPQGNVTFHWFGKLGYGHTGLTNDSTIPEFIDQFIGICDDQNKQRKII